MQGSTIKTAVLAVLLASTLPVMACGSADTPTSPTQSGPTVATAITLKGSISQMTRSGAGGIDIMFRLNDEPFVRGDANTVVIDGSITGNTTYLRDGQTVTIDGLQREDHVYARLVVIDTKP